jgi:hypothetical protein
MTHFSKAELRLPTATPDRIYHKTRPNDLHTASLLNKIGVLFQIILLVLSLVFAFSAASAHPLLSENDQGDSHGSGSHVMPRKVSYQVSQQAPQPVSKSVSQPIFRPKSRQVSGRASQRVSDRTFHQISHQALGGLKIVPVRSLSENRAGNSLDNSLNNSLNNSPGDNSDHYVRNGQNDALDNDQPLQASHMQNQQAPIIEDALLLASKIDVEITGMIVHTTVTQTFKNQTADWIEGLYRFPLPDKAAVDSMTMLVGNRRIVGKIKEKEAARKTYANAVKAGKKAALLEEHRPNMFSSRVGNVAPGAIIVVELTFLSYAEQKGLNFSWTMPQAITPRFNFDMPMVDGDGISTAPGGMGHYAYNPEGPEGIKGPANELAKGSVTEPASGSAVGLSSGFAQVGSGVTDRSNPVHHRRNASVNHQGKAAPDYENVKAQGVNPTSFHIRLNAGTVVKNLISSSHDLAVTYHGQGGVAAPRNEDDGIDATNPLHPRDVSSATNAVTVNDTGRFEPYENIANIGIYEIRLKDMALPGDRDFKLSWDLTPAATAKPILFRESAPPYYPVC